MFGRCQTVVSTRYHTDYQPRCRRIYRGHLAWYGMGWTHAILTIIAVVGGSTFAADSLWQIPIYHNGDFVHAGDLGIPLLYAQPLVGVAVLVPPPAVIGIILWRRKVFGEPPNINRKLSWPTITTVIILGLWWMVPLGSIGMMYLHRLIDG